MWATLQIVFVLLGIVLAFVGNQFAQPILLHAGIGFFGLAMMAMGWQGILTQHMVLRSRRGGYRGTFTGVPAIFQGVQFNFLGLFFIGVAFMMSFDSGEQIAQQIARRPGLLLVLVGGLCLLQAGIRLLSSQEARQTAGAMAFLDLFVARLLPGIILLVVGLVLSLLGLFEALAPSRFDELGGRLLEQFYGLN
jgi:hypothetical protein